MVCEKKTGRVVQVLMRVSKLPWPQTSKPSSMTSSQSLRPLRTMLTLNEAYHLFSANYRASEQKFPPGMGNKEDPPRPVKATMWWLTWFPIHRTAQVTLRALYRYMLNERHHGSEPLLLPSPGSPAATESGCKAVFSVHVHPFERGRAPFHFSIIFTH